MRQISSYYSRDEYVKINPAARAYFSLTASKMKFKFPGSASDIFPFRPIPGTEDFDHAVKIGYQAGIKLLRAGAQLIVTTRFPRDAAERECLEELKLKAEFFDCRPILITQTETVGKAAGHTDVSLWYALKGDRRRELEIDENEFRQARWFHRDALPENTDPHFGRFVQKLYGKIE